MANANPGPDIIEFTPGLQVNAGTPANGNAPYMLEITESVVIDGNGGALKGFQHWIDSNGVINGVNFCPGSNNGTVYVLAEMPGLLKVGINNQDNSGIEVTVKDLDIEHFNSLAVIEQNATLIFENVKAKKIYSSYDCTPTPLFGVDPGASLTLRSSEFTECESWGADAIAGSNAGDLIIENCLFSEINNRNNFAVFWQGQTNSKIDIVSSRFVLTGGINISGGATECNFVNSTWADGINIPTDGGRFINDSSGGVMNIIASSILWGSNLCNFGCQSNEVLIDSKQGQINIIDSAIGFNNETSGSNDLITLGGLLSNFTANENTWIEPTSEQDAASLKAITGQPNLITVNSTSALNSPVVSSISDIVLLQPNISGELIDVITSDLINPITGVPITLDVIGNERFDTNGFRDIGAIQLSLAPFLILEGSVQQSVDLSWNEPLHHDNFPIVRYELSYSETGSSTPTIVVVDMPNLTETISGLSYGQTYEFKVRAVYDDNGTEVVGPFSNIVDVPLFAPFNITPNLTATSGNAEVNVSWDLPDLGGRTFERYLLLYRIAGTTEILGGSGSITDPNQTSYLATGLTNDTTYEFILSVKASGEWSTEVFATATPSASLGVDEFLRNKILYYPNPVNDYLNILTEESFHVKLFSVNGTLILDLINEKKLDISNLKTGLYIIQLQIDDKLYFGKVLKN